MEGFPLKEESEHEWIMLEHNPHLDISWNTIIRLLVLNHVVPPWYGLLVPSLVSWTRVSVLDQSLSTFEPNS